MLIEYQVFALTVCFGTLIFLVFLFWGEIKPNIAKANKWHYRGDLRRLKTKEALLKQENQQLLAANVKLQDEVRYWKRKYMEVIKK